MYISEYINQLKCARSRFPVCLILTPRDFVRGEPIDITNLRSTRADVEQADKVMVIDHRFSPDVPMKITILKERNDEIQEYTYLSRPFDLWFG